MSVTSATLQLTLSVQELVPSAPDATSANNSVLHNQFNVSKTFTGASSPPATKNTSFEQALVAGAATLDLTALTGTGGGAVTGNALKVQGILIKNKTGNAGTMTFAKGASNGYTGFGANFNITIPIGGAILIDPNNAGATISGTNKTIDVTGSGTDTMQIVVIFG